MNNIHTLIIIAEVWNGDRIYVVYGTREKKYFMDLCGRRERFINETLPTIPGRKGATIFSTFEIPGAILFNNPMRITGRYEINEDYKDEDNEIMDELNIYEKFEEYLERLWSLYSQEVF